jgi:hypothetical protein
MRHEVHTQPLRWHYYRKARVAEQLLPNGLVLATADKMAISLVLIILLGHWDAHQRHLANN